MVVRVLLFCTISWLSLIPLSAYEPGGVIAPVCLADSGIKITVRGEVFDRATKQPLAAQVTYEVLNQGPPQPQPVQLDPATGTFTLELPAGAEYRFVVEADGYRQMIKRVNLMEAGPEDQVELTLDLQPLVAPSRVIPADPFGTLLTIVYFKGSSVELTDASRRELDRLLKLLRTNPRIRLSVQGHADVKGSFEHNMRLADLRTQAVRAYLMAHDIAPYRLPAIAYGNAFMMTTFPKDRHLNNRVEFHLRTE